MRYFLFATVAVMIASTTAIAATPNGVWLSADGRVKVRVTHCNDSLCGAIVWLKQPIDPQTQRPRTDKLNPDITKRDRPLLGMQVARDFRPTGDNKWAGQIYNADEGKVYKINLTLTNPRKLALKGCVLGIFCRTQTWTRTN
jgi:uncharacterized protein (DUF2147 family)